MKDRAVEQAEDESKPKTTSKQKSVTSIFDEKSPQVASAEETFGAKYNSTYLTYWSCVALLGELSDQLKPSSPGDYYSWPSFCDSFTATFIQSHLSPVQKLLHLRQRTKSEAYDIVSKVPLEDSGFDIAFKIKKPLLQLKFANFLNFPQL